MTNRPKAIGTATETATVRYLNANGFGGAERPALHGSLDEGDITGTPGLAWEVKGGKAAETASDAQIAAWLEEAETERRNKRADYAVLVLKRAGKGAANAGAWWAFLPGRTFVELALDQPHSYAGLTYLPAVRVTLADAVHLLRDAGYGDPIDIGDDSP